MIELKIYVPRPGSWPAHKMAAGSGAVGRPLSDERWEIVVYFEGNLFYVKDLDTWEARVHRAAGRCLQQYPTIDKGLFEPKDLIQVGVYTCEDLRCHGHVIEVTDRDSLNLWLHGYDDESTDSVLSAD